MLEILLVFMIIGAVVAVEVHDMLSSVISVGVVGLGLVVSFLLLQAPDLAIVQLIVEILVLIILIRATVGSGNVSYRKRELSISIAFVIFVFVFLSGAYVVLGQLPRLGNPVMRVSQGYTEQCLKTGGASNIVSAVALDFRAYDTLGEAAILFAAVIGVSTVMRRIGRIKK
jgi:multicomponent Na+:H+ antiporter subunit B